MRQWQVRRAGVRGARLHRANEHSCESGPSVSAVNPAGVTSRIGNSLGQLGLLHAVERRHRLRKIDVFRSRAKDAERVQAKWLVLLVALAHVAKPLFVRPVPVKVNAETGCKSEGSVSFVLHA